MGDNDILSVWVSKEKSIIKIGVFEKKNHHEQNTCKSLHFKLLHI